MLQLSHYQYGFLSGHDSSTNPLEKAEEKRTIQVALERFYKLLSPDLEYHHKFFETGQDCVKTHSLASAGITLKDWLVLMASWPIRG